MLTIELVSLFIVKLLAVNLNILLFYALFNRIQDTNVLFINLFKGLSGKL